MIATRMKFDSTTKYSLPSSHLVFFNRVVLFEDVHFVRHHVRRSCSSGLGTRITILLVSFYYSQLDTKHYAGLSHSFWKRGIATRADYKIRTIVFPNFQPAHPTHKQLVLITQVRSCSGFRFYFINGLR